MGFNFKEISPENLYLYWEVIQKDLNKTLKYSPEQICSGDVYVELKSKRAVLFIVEDFSCNYVGFFVLQFSVSFSDNVCNVWLLGSSVKGTIKQFSELIHRSALRYKSNKVVVSTTRPGMERVLKNIGMEKTYTTFKAEI